MSMPHLKVNVNGKRYTISGLTRGTCSKQILCALAKVDAELQASKTFKDSEDSASEVQSERPRQARESRRKSKGEEKCENCKDVEGKTKIGKRNESRKTRSTKKSSWLDSKGIQTSNGMLDTLGKVTESQQNCLSTQHEEKDLKVKVLENSLQTFKDLNGKQDVEGNSVMAENKDGKGTLSVEDQAKDTDHDTGISELHSDSSFDAQVLHNNEREAKTESGSVEKHLHRASPIEVKCASTNTDPMEAADNTDAHIRENENVYFPDNHFIVAELLGSEADVEIDDECTCSCVYVDSGSEELQDEIEKVRGDLKSTEAKLVEQNKMIESLNALIHEDQRKAKERFADNDVTVDVSDDVSKRINELKQSIEFSNQLYAYQKIETRANALELERVESQIRRKRWHVESLLNELRNLKKNLPKGGGQGRNVDYRREGTLV